MNKEIERPLGAERNPGPRARRAAPGRFVPGLAAICVIVAAGAYIALQDDRLRTPPPVTEPVPSEAGADDREPVLPPVREVSDGPAIIKVPPGDNGSGGGVIVIRDPSAIGQNLRVAHLPDRALLDQSETGPLPVRAADGRRPFDVYARPWSGSRGAKVAIVIGGLGLSQTGTQEAIARLPSEVTLAFAPQGNSIGRWMQAARREGHELLMQVPLEPFDYPRVNPGRNTLTVDASTEQNLGHLRWALSRTTNYVGVMNYMGARFTADTDRFGPVIAEIGERGLLYLDDGSSARSLAPLLAQANKVPFAAADTAIDIERDRASILKKLDELEATARARGSAIGVGSAFDVTVDAVAGWVGEARRRGIEIVPVSALAMDPEKG